MLDVFERIGAVKKIVRATFPEMRVPEMRRHLSHIRKFEVGVCRELSERQEVIRDLMAIHQIRVGTAYHWFRVTTLPEYIQAQLRNREISVTEAFRRNLERNRPQEVLAEELRTEILNYVEKLAERDFLGGGEYALR